MLFYDPQYYFSHPIEIFKVWEGGMAFHGGLIGALIGVLLFCRRYKAPALTVLDLCSPRRADWHLSWPNRQFHSPRALGSPDRCSLGRRLPGDGWPAAPSQPDLRSAARRLLAFVILYTLAQMGALRRPGVITGVFAIVYGAARIFSEFFREPDPRLEDLGRGLTMGMVLSLPLIIVGIGVLAWSFGGESRHDAAPR